MVPVALIITGITFVFTFHMRCIYTASFLYFKIFSASFLITFLSPGIATAISIVNKKVQLDGTVCRHLFTAKLLYMFRVSQYPSSGALKTVTATSGIGHTVKYKLKIN